MSLQKCKRDADYSDSSTPSDISDLPFEDTREYSHKDFYRLVKELKKDTVELRKDLERNHADTARNHADTAQRLKSLADELAAERKATTLLLEYSAGAVMCTCVEMRLKQLLNIDYRDRDFSVGKWLGATQQTDDWFLKNLGMSKNDFQRLRDRLWGTKYTSGRNDIAHTAIPDAETSRIAFDAVRQWRCSALLTGNLGRILCQLYNNDERFQ